MRLILWKPQNSYKMLGDSHQNSVSGKGEHLSRVCVFNSGSNILFCFSFSYQIFMENASQEKEEVADKVLRWAVN